MHYKELCKLMGVTDYNVPNAHCYTKHDTYQKNNASNRTERSKSIVKHHEDINGNPKSRYFKAGGHVKDRQDLAVGAVAKIRKGQYNY